MQIQEGTTLIIIIRDFKCSCFCAAAVLIDSGSLRQISSVFIRADWTASHACFPTELPRNAVFHAISDLHGQRTSEKCFNLPRPYFLSWACTPTHNPYLQQPLWGLTRDIHIIVSPKLLLSPIKIWRIRMVRWRSRCGTRGVRVIFWQLCLEPWNQTDAPNRVRFLLLKTVLLLSGSGQTPYTHAQEEIVDANNIWALVVCAQCTACFQKTKCVQK